MTANLISLPEVEQLAREFRTAKPFPFVTIDGLLAPEFAREVAAAYPTAADAQTIGRTFRAVNEAGKTQVTRQELFPGPVRRLCDVVSSTEFLEVLSRITGIRDLLADPELEGGGIHVMRPGGHLDVHVDFNRIAHRSLFRRLNMLIFFNPRWDEAWHGDLELWDAAVRVRQHRFSPLLNRCVIFETSERSFHGVAKIDCPSGFNRNSFAAYYYTREAPEGYVGTDHDTIFKARPTEFWKGKVSMPAERLLSRSRVIRGLRRLLS